MININREKVFKIEMIIFVILLFLQNFAIIKTKSFGISALVIFLIFLTIKYKFVMKPNWNFIRIMCVFTIVILLSSAINGYMNIMQVIRLYMIFFVIWSAYKYIKLIQEKKQISFFYNIFSIAIIVITSYGIYQLIASNFKLPMFLNFFSNNPSYGERKIFEVYTGWVDTGRIYSTFYEPSAYGIFLSMAYFFIMNQDSVSKKQKIAITILSFINIIFTYSRSAWVTFVYFICIYLLFRLLKKESILKKIGKACIIILPLISLTIMSTLGLTIFKDLSSIKRSYSSLYYLQESTNSIKDVMIGNGVGSVSKEEGDIIFNNVHIEKFTHNGYIEIAYQLGLPFLIFVIYVILKYLKNKGMTDNWIAYASIFTLCCFGSMYCVESITALLVIILGSQEKEILEESKKIENLIE